MIQLLDTRDRDHDEEQQPGQGEDEPVNPNLPIRQYLDKHIMPSLIEALEKLTQDKPEDPIQYIGEYLLREEDHMKKCWDSEAQQPSKIEDNRT